MSSIFRKYTCTHCGEPATEAAHFDEQGVVVIQKYCDACEPEMFERLQKDAQQVILVIE